MYVHLAILAAFVFLYSLIAGRVEKMPISGPIVFMAFGLLCGPYGLNILTLEVDGEGLRTLAEVTLALVLFTDAASANLGVLKHSIQLPVRLLLIGLPLTILLGFGAGYFLFQGLSLLEIAILATMLAPTDAALGKAVVTNESVPSNMREGLNVESGLNDGICVPILFVFLALAGSSSPDGGTLHLTLQLVTEEIGIGAAVGLSLTFVGAWMLRYCASRDWITETWVQLPVIALALSCFAVAQALGGSGFIASFTGGILFGALVKTHKEKLLCAAEGTGDTLALATWVVFGATVVAQFAGSLNWQVVLYAVLSLTVVRMLPVYLTLAGTGITKPGKLFMGWFGPRGLASIVFAVIVLNAKLPHGNTIALVVVCTVVLSILAHGFSANPLAKALGRNSK